ncbi:MAG: hypothetical protein ACO3FI_02630 [Cyclobacteriaceae bacterium]
MGVFIFLIGVAILIYQIRINSKYNSIRNMQDGFILIIKNLEDRIKSLELNKAIADKEDIQVFQKEVREKDETEINTTVNGKKDGLWVSWYDASRKKAEGNYLAGKRNGLWTWWYEDGQKKAEVNYKNGSEEGTLTMWHYNGNRKLLITYENGEIISRKEWDETGGESRESSLADSKNEAVEVTAPNGPANDPKPSQIPISIGKKKENEFFVKLERNLAGIWKKLEKQFIENWTGILGSIIMVIGVGFLGIYTALKISAPGRFILISGFSVMLGGLFFYLHKKPDWLKLALWLRSSAGAIFLFACTGSITIPGLRWIESGPVLLLILSTGVLVNLYLGYIGKNQGLASLHVLLSLVGVWIIPSSPTTLIIGAIITLFGVGLTYREKWNAHLLLTITSFAVFHLTYWLSLNHPINVEEKIYGIVTILAVGIASALVHYRDAYSSKTFERLPFIVHLVNWFYFGLSLYLYSEGSQIATFALAGGSIAAYLLSRRAKKLNIRWLFLTDTLIAQVTAIICLATLFNWQVDGSIIWASIFIEGLLFLFIAQKENDLFLYKVGTGAITIVGSSLLFYSSLSFDQLNRGLLHSQPGSLLVSAISATYFLYYSGKSSTIDLSGLFKFFNLKFNENIRHPLLSIIVGFMLVSYYSQIFQISWSIYTVVGLLAALLFLRDKLQSVELDLITIIFLAGAHIVNWYALSHIKDQSYVEILIVGLPILVASAMSIKLSFVKSVSGFLNWIGVYLFSIHLIFLSYYLLNPISALAVAFGWMALALAAILLVNLVSKKSAQYHHLDRYILHAGYTVIVLFLIRHVYFDLNSDELLGMMKGRIWVALFAFIVFLVWATAKNKANADYNSWKYLHPLFAELILLFSFFTLNFELSYKDLALTWLGMAITTFAVANWKHGLIGRLTLYSFVLFLLSIIQQFYIYFIVFTNARDTGIPIQEFISASVFILFSLVFLIVFYRYAKLKFDCPPALRYLEKVVEMINRQVAAIGVYVYSVFILLITYLMFAPTSDIIPGIIWLLLSAILITLSVSFYGKRFKVLYVDRYLLHIFYLFIAAFLIRHVLVHIQIENYVGMFKIRFLIEILAISVFAYCATIKRPDTATYKSWDYLHPLLIELLIVFSIFTIALEVDGIWQPLIWVALSFSFAIVGSSKYESLSRLLFYSLLLYWVAAFQTAFITSSYVVPSNETFAQPWIYGTLSLIFQFAFLIYFYLKSNVVNVVLPKSLVFLTKPIGQVEKHRNAYVFYPLIVCTAIFLFWTFDKSLLTLLWVIECLAILMISLVLRKQHFRYVALGSLAICIIRLVFFDMAQSSTLTRAIAFLSVGVIMLVMNSLYNKFKSRFE